MTISQAQLDQVLSEREIKKFWLGYFQERLRESVNQAILERYQALREKTGLSKAELAQKIGRRPEQLTRWLTSPNNLELDTISDLALALGTVPRLELDLTSTLFDVARANAQNEVSTFVADQITLHGNSPSSSANGQHVVLNPVAKSPAFRLHETAAGK